MKVSIKGQNGEYSPESPFCVDTSRNPKVSGAIRIPDRFPLAAWRGRVATVTDPTPAASLAKATP